jgi:hypothetical protein
MIIQWDTAVDAFTRRVAERFVIIFNVISSPAFFEPLIAGRTLELGAGYAQHVPVAVLALEHGSHAAFAVVGHGTDL